jgi:6-phosphogluconate dehydrogenase
MPRKPAIRAGLMTHSAIWKLIAVNSFNQPHQAQRDYFGAHTYQRVDMPGIFHTEWGTYDN